jgi:hypothetical protein
MLRRRAKCHDVQRSNTERMRVTVAKLQDMEVALIHTSWRSTARSMAATMQIPGNPEDSLVAFFIFGPAQESIGQAHSVVPKELRSLFPAQWVFRIRPCESKPPGACVSRHVKPREE